MPRIWPRRDRSEIGAPTEVSGLGNVGWSIGSRKVAQPDGRLRPKEEPLELELSLETIERHADLLGARRSHHPTSGMQQAMIVWRLQRDYGTRYVQMLLEYNSRLKAAGVQRAHTVGPTGERDEWKTVEGKVSATVVPQTDSNVSKRAAAEMDRVEHVRRPR